LNNKFIRKKKKNGKYLRGEKLGRAQSTQPHTPTGSSCSARMRVEREKKLREEAKMARKKNWRRFLRRGMCELWKLFGLAVFVCV